MGLIDLRTWSRLNSIFSPNSSTVGVLEITLSTSIFLYGGRTT